jgi:mannosyltransferase
MRRQSADGDPIDIPTAAPEHPRVTWALRPGALATAAMIVGTAFATVFSAVLAGRPSLWGDETFTATFIRQPWGRMLRDLGHIDVNMSVYYVVAKVWTAVVGTGDGALRSLSIVCAVAALVVTYRIGVRLLDRRLACWLVALIAVNPFFLRVALTARPYAMVLLASAVATLVLLRAIDERRVSWWALYAVVGVVAFYVHMTAIFFLATHAVVVLLAKVRPRTGPLVAAAILLVGAIPAAVFVAPADTLAWIGKPSLHDLARLVVHVAGSAVLLPFLALAALAGLVTITRAVRGRTVTTADWYLAAGVLAPIVVVVVLLPKQSLFVELYFAVLLVPLLALVVRGVTSWVPTRRAEPVLLGLTALSLLAGAVGVWRQPLTTDQDWRGASAHLAQLVKPGDALTFPDAFYRIAAEHYRGDHPAWTQASPLLPAAPWGSVRPYELDRIKRTGSELNQGNIVNQLQGHARVWIVGPDGSEMDTVATVLVAQHYNLAEHHTDDAGIIEDLYTR